MTTSPNLSYPFHGEAMQLREPISALRTEVDIRSNVERVSGSAADVESLQSPSTIRARARLLFERALAGESAYFRVDRGRLDAVAELVRDKLAEAPAPITGRVHGRMRHFDCGRRARTREVAAALAGLPPFDRARAWVDAVVPSVLLDAGAGAAWSYVEGGERYTRSEGIALASLAMFREGKLSRSGAPMVCDAGGLLTLTERSLAAAFQVSRENPLVGLEGRLELMHALGRALAAHGDESARPAQLFDLATAAASGSTVDATSVLALVLARLGEIWPAHLVVAGVNVGDVWRHPALGTGVGALLPFHKLSQWLTYSLVEPFREGGLELGSLDQLTPLAEYRNGGLLLDMGAISLCDPSLAEVSYAIGDPLIVEWRALTISLLDDLRPLLRSNENACAGALEAATWAAGRAIARSRRQDGGSPLSIASDGTVF